MPEYDGRVHWLALGGTIQCLGEDPLDIDRYHLTGGTLRPVDLITPVSELVGTVTSEEVSGTPSHDLAPAAVLDLLGRVRRLRSTDLGAAPVGYVVSVGSNGMEELAYLLWLLHEGPEPLVVTSSMWPPTAVGSDALGNLVGSIAAARAIPPDTGYGPVGPGDLSGPTPVMIVADGVVLHPAAAFKTHTTRRDSFSASAAPIGKVWPGEGVSLRARTSRSPVAGATVTGDLPRVDISYSYLGADGTAIEAAVAAGARAVVCAGMGGGFGTASERDAVRRAITAGVVVCQATRTPFGSVNEPSRTTLDPAVLLSDRLTPQKARLALSVGLAVGLDRAGLQALLATPALLEGDA
ncbi:asparaginase domain-containing protein [Nocardioides sp. YIM 152315]|uniref:asparaginase n=1 Tax=Nocardioides sp. YIM 152315 TaxID=3031760 RepID=UPI0023DC262A|nr:asparaginase domain-containing protein [Nocardioides sp. YIM 152315]MDF1604511.1 asparaginase domain-containing protein [Nocardioides sp. YIM 152315]